MPKEAFLINPPSRFYLPPPGRHTARNPFGEEALIIGGLNPPEPKKRAKARKKTKESGMAIRRRKRRAAVGRPRKARRRVRRNPASRVVYLAAPKKRRAKRSRARRSMILAHNAPRRRKRTYRHRVHRRNPASAGGGRAISLRHPATLLMPIAVGVGANMMADRLPSMLNLSGNSALAAQAGLLIGGGLLLPKIVGNTATTVFVAVVGAKLVTSLINQYVFNAGLSGLGEIPYQISPYQSGVGGLGSLGAFPSEQFAGLGAAPYDVQY